MSGWLAGGALLVVVVPVVLIGAAIGAVTPSTAPGGMPGAVPDIPPLMLAAYANAAARSASIPGGCPVRWSVLAGIGRVESNHGQHWTTTIGPDGDTAPPIIGPRLDGSGGTAAIADTDDGRWDRDPVWDRAVGPTQFIPSSWRRFGQDGNDDSVADPHNIYDATLATVAHLCQAPAPPAGGKDLTDPAQLRQALFAYNRSAAYVDAVLTAIATYDALTAPPAAGAYTLPVAPDLLTPQLLAATHHDYPAWDLPVPVGTPVVAVHGGRVAAVTSIASRCGLGVIIAGDDGYSYTYCHASAVHATAGATVAAGQPILASGNTGNSTGPHLHLGIRRPDRTSICPQPLLTAWYRGVPAHPATATATGCTY